LPPPWTVQERDESFVVVDAAGHHVAYVYFKEERTLHTDPTAIDKDTARRVARAIAKTAERRTVPKSFPNRPDENSAGSCLRGGTRSASQGWTGPLIGG